MSAWAPKLGVTEEHVCFLTCSFCLRLNIIYNDNIFYKARVSIFRKYAQYMIAERKYTNYQKRNRKLDVHLDKPVSWFLHGQNCCNTLVYNVLEQEEEISIGVWPQFAIDIYTTRMASLYDASFRWESEAREPQKRQQKAQRDKKYFPSTATA